MKSQNATATIGNVTSCSGEDILVPMNVTDFIDVGAMTIYIGYDTNVAEFNSIQNLNPAVTGGLTYNASDGQVNIAYSNPTSFTITDGKLFDLSFNYLGDSCNLPFEPGTEIANSDLEVIPLDTFPGSIANSIQIVDQPDSTESYPDNDVMFSITVLGNPDYQWQENSGSGWEDLQNNANYSGVNTDTLFIFDVPLSFNGNTYRCVLTSDACTLISDVALLEVAQAFPTATLGLTNSCPDNEIEEPLFVGDFLDVVEFTFNISFDTSQLAYQSLENINPDLLDGTFSVTPLSDPAGIVIHWVNSDPVSITSGSLFDIQFIYGAGNQSLVFEPGSVVINSSNNPIDITFNNGSVNQNDIPVIINQPQNDSVLDNQDASFIVDAEGATEYSWQVSTDGGESWTFLSETIPYYNVHTPILTISPATFNMNGYQYSCLLSNGNCNVNSLAATLFVDTLTYVNTLELSEEIQIFPNPFTNRLNIFLPETKSEYDFLNIYNVSGSLIYNLPILSGSHERTIKLNLSSLPEGTYILKMSTGNKGDMDVYDRLIIKTK